MNCMIFFTCSLVRWKSSDRISSVSWTKMLPSMRSRTKKASTASARPMKRRQRDTSSTDSVDRSDGGCQAGRSPLARGCWGRGSPEEADELSELLRVGVPVGGASMTPCVR
ncbi:hypothetical protein ANANG_G00113520 [Anguilla anguilla]|uniref:Uncharacterized protein n=1 Tax=Anguilla anguilla TaxID=7936 RepID=A0A9D3MC79_ANGAN|nr:hypothetical protein ANANG_G00113520 [Anguilla anguilla]